MILLSNSCLALSGLREGLRSFLRLSLLFGLKFTGAIGSLAFTISIGAVCPPTTSVVIGDKKGRVGVGIGKAADTPVAIDKATSAAKKSMITVRLTKNNSIAHPVEAKYSSARISIMPAPGKGVIAGSAVRVVLELAGVKEVSSKILSRSKNKLNIARATLKALEMLKKEKVKASEKIS